MRKRFADIYWQVCDVQNRRPDWTAAECRRFLDDLEESIMEAMCEAGWGIIDDALEQAEMSEEESNATKDR
jgi:hypothetical protein